LLWRAGGGQPGLAAARADNSPPPARPGGQPPPAGNGHKHKQDQYHGNNFAKVWTCRGPGSCGFQFNKFSDSKCYKCGAHWDFSKRDQAKGTTGKGKSKQGGGDQTPPWKQPANPAKAGQAGQQQGGEGITGAKFFKQGEAMEVDEEAHLSGALPDGKEDDFEIAKAKQASAKQALEKVEKAIGQLEVLLAEDPADHSIKSAIASYQDRKKVALAAVEQAGAEFDKLRQSRGGIGHWEHKKNRAQRKLNQAKKKKAAAEEALAKAQEHLEKCKEDVQYHQAAFDEAQATYIEKAKAVGAPSAGGGDAAAGAGGDNPASHITIQDVRRLLDGGDDFGISGCPEILAQVRSLFGTALARMATAAGEEQQVAPPEGDKVQEEEVEQESPRFDEDDLELAGKKDGEAKEADRARSRSPRGSIGGK
jgi:hypothetical protein